MEHFNTMSVVKKRLMEADTGSLQGKEPQFSPNVLLQMKHNYYSNLENVPSGIFFPVKYNLLGSNGNSGGRSLVHIHGQ